MTQRNKSEVRVLVVDDEPGMRDMLSFELGSQGYKVFTAGDGLEAITVVRAQMIDLVISDIKMPRMDGVAALAEIKKINPNIEVIMATDFGTIETAVDAMKNGAYDFIQKPYNLDEISALVEKALEKNELKTMIALYESSRAIFSTVHLDDLLALVMDLIQKGLRADEGSILFLDAQKKLYIVASKGIDQAISKQVHLEMGERIAGWAAEKRKELLLINGLEKYPEFSHIDQNERIGSAIVVPLIHQEDLLGVLTLNRLTSHENFNSTDLRHACIFASQVSQAVRNARLFQNLENKVEELKKAYRQLDETKTQLVDSEKLAAIGRLLAGIAHEINNPLTSILGYSEMLLQSDMKSELKEDLTTVFHEAQRCRKIVQDLLTFARRSRPITERADIGTLIDQTLESLALEVEKNSVRVKKNYGAYPSIYVDPMQIQQVFMNIVKNAIQAMEKTTKEKQIEITISMPTAQSLRIVFSDSGPGINKEDLDRIFEPFFTTKGIGKGTGLGLSLSYGIVQQHGGSLLVESQKGKGTSFIIEIPAVTQKKEEAGSADSKTALSQKTLEDLGKKRILIVEDEEPIRIFLKRLLSTKGLQVEMAADGETAVSLMDQQTFDLVLCDYLIPKMNGIQVFEKIKKMQPALAKRFIFVSGCSTDKVLDAFLHQNKLLRITKPFVPDQLISIVVKRLSAQD